MLQASLSARLPNAVVLGTYFLVVVQNSLSEFCSKLLFLAVPTGNYRDSSILRCGLLATEIRSGTEGGLNEGRIDRQVVGGNSSTHKPRISVHSDFFEQTPGPLDRQRNSTSKS